MRLKNGGGGGEGHLCRHRDSHCPMAVVSCQDFLAYLNVGLLEEPPPHTAHLPRHNLLTHRAEDKGSGIPECTHAERAARL